jgi:glucokinase
MSTPGAQANQARVVAGVEIADSGTRLTATASHSTAHGAQRWHARLLAPPMPDEAVAQVDALLSQMLRELGSAALAAVGVALQGRVDADRGVALAVRQAPDWAGYPLAERLAELRHVPVRLETTVNAAALAEATLGGQGGEEGAADILYIHCGRDVASALVYRGGIIHGAHGAEGMLAHLLVLPGGPRCSCGLHGHLEPLASAQSIVRRMIGRASDTDESNAAMQRITGGRAEALTVAQVVRLATEGDTTAAAVIAEAVDALAMGLANAVALLDPGVLIIGGPLVEAGEYFLTALRTRVAELCVPYTLAPTLAWGRLEPGAALLGARLLAERVIAS